jgi:hypothetical protein
MAVTRFEIASRSLVLGGQPFGKAGAYEKIAGTAHIATPPDHAANQAITDLALAPRDAAGRVASQADFYVLRPVDPRKGNRHLLLDVPNRGRKVALGMFNSTPRVPDPTTAEDFGNGFLMRRGFTVAWCGWQHDVPRVDGLMALTVPRARGANGPIAGLVRCEFRPNVATDVLPLADRYHVPQPALDVEEPGARLTVREHVGAPEVAIARSAWRFARREGGRLVPDASHVHLAGGFAPGKIYDLVYRAQDPPLVGLGLLAVRDIGSWLRYESAESGNPCAGEIERATVFGVSQCGRFLRHFLHLGLNEDEAGRAVFDAVFPFVAGARRGEFNMRFGQPSLNALQAVGDLFPFTHGEQVDPVTGQRDALLGRLAARRHMPKIFEINTSAEYWRGDASLVHTDVEGKVDVEVPPQVRLYFFAGCQHTPGALPPPPADPNTGGRGRHAFNAVDYAPLLRAALVNLDDWMRTGAEPPPSAVPRLRDGTAVAATSTAPTYARIPGAAFPDRVSAPTRLDFGPEAARGIVTELPPKSGAPFPTLVSAVDADGNEVAGIRPVELAVPLGTFTGWNPRHPEQGAPGDLMSMMGSTLPFARTRAERERAGDPRLSIAERYGSRAAYLDAVRAAARALVAARHLLEEDVDRVVERAGQQWDVFEGGLAGESDR